MADKKDSRRKVVVEEVSSPSELTKEEKTEEIKETADTPKEEKEAVSEPVRAVEEVSAEGDTPEAKKPADTAILSDEITQSSPKKGGSNFFIYILIPAFLILGALIGGVFFYQQRVSMQEEVAVQPTPEAAIEGQPEISPEELLLEDPDLEAHSIEILNGSGIAGEAGRARSLLERAGFTISLTGNADSYDYPQTIIQVKEEVDPSFITALSSALGTAYEVGRTETLPETETNDVIVIIGSNKADEEED